MASPSEMKKEKLSELEFNQSIIDSLQKEIDNIQVRNNAISEKKQDEPVPNTKDHLVVPFKRVELGKLLESTPTKPFDVIGYVFNYNKNTSIAHNIFKDVAVLEDGTLNDSAYELILELPLRKYELSSKDFVAAKNVVAEHDSDNKKIKLTPGLNFSVIGNPNMEGYEDVVQARNILFGI